MPLAGRGQRLPGRQRGIAQHQAEALVLAGAGRDLPHARRFRGGGGRGAEQRGGLRKCRGRRFHDQRGRLDRGDGLRYGDGRGRLGSAGASQHGLGRLGIGGHCLDRFRQRQAKLRSHHVAAAVFVFGEVVERGAQPGPVRHHQQAAARATGGRRRVQRRPERDMARGGVRRQHVLDQVRQRQPQPRGRQGGTIAVVSSTSLAATISTRRSAAGMSAAKGVAFAQQFGGMGQARTAALVRYRRADQCKRHGAKLPRLRLVVRPLRQADVEGGAQGLPKWNRSVWVGRRGRPPGFGATAYLACVTKARQYSPV